MTTISDLSPAGTLTGTEPIPIDQDDATVKTTVTEIAAFAAATFGSVSINDSTTTTTRTWSSNKINTEVSAKSNTTSPTFTGTPAAPTAALGTNTTQLATTAFVKAAVDSLVDSAPGTLDTLNELAAALGDDANFASTMVTALAGKATLNMTINTEAGTARTLSAGDVNNLTRMTSASASAYTFAPNATVAVEVGATVHIRQAGAGQVTLVAGAGVTLNTPETLKLRKQGSTISATKVATDEWDVYGDLEAAP